MTPPDTTLASPQIEWPDEIWAESDFEGGFGIYRTGFFATVDHPCEHAKYVHHGIYDSIKKYHATMIENGQLITLADHTAAMQAAVAKAVEAEREAAKQLVWTLGHEIRSAMLVDEDNEQTVLDMVKATAATIRSRGVAG